MAFVFIRHEVEDFEKWKSAFDGAFEFRKEKGEKSSKIFKNSDNPNEISGLFEWESTESAKQFFESEELKEKMNEAGVSGEPTVYFLDEIE